MYKKNTESNMLNYRQIFYFIGLFCDSIFQNCTLEIYSLEIAY